MAISFLFLALLFFIFLVSPSVSFSSALNFSLPDGSSLSVENPKDVLISPRGIFTAGFYLVGENAYCLAIWFSKPFCSNDCTVVWMANRDFPVNGKSSKLLLQENGNLVLTDAGKSIAWSSETQSFSPTKLHLNDHGNLALLDLSGTVLWQSFDSPTDTLLSMQPLTREQQLVSSKSAKDFSSGVYKFFFDDDNLLHLLYDGPDTSSLYWPDPWLRSWEGNRFPYNNTRVLFIDSLGKFVSSDNLTSVSADYGLKRQRILKLDYDGNARLYSREEDSADWVVSWQAISDTCTIHGVCGPNSTCTYHPNSPNGRKCSCLPGYRTRNVRDWSYGCEPEFNSSFGKDSGVGFIKIKHIEFFGNDYRYRPNCTIQKCQELCLQLFNCKGFQYRYGYHSPNCFPKMLMLNGRHSPNFGGDMYIKVPKTSLALYKGLVSPMERKCSPDFHKQVHRVYGKNPENGTLRFILWFAVALGGIEFIGMFLVWCFLTIKSHKNVADTQRYHPAITGFKRFTLSELKRATKNFTEEIGRGGGGIVYKGKLSDNRVAAIKRLNTANQGEEEFLAELSFIGKLNHMNLIDMWGFCAEGKHRLLVYESMEHGSLAKCLSTEALDSEKRFDIAIGTARGLAYLHEECLEWVLHCDVKPQNILVDSEYLPKVSDFGLSKILKREQNNSSFSKIRGTRGYMAPEWISNMPITSKVDVYSYGVVLLEMLTGKSPGTGVGVQQNSGEMEAGRLVRWVREKKNGRGFSIEEILDPKVELEGENEIAKMETLLKVALQCVEEDAESRPAMRTIVEMLEHFEI